MILGIEVSLFLSLCFVLTMSSS